MDRSHIKARAIRDANASARVALQRVTENPDATPAELLEAARLLAELTK